MQRVFFSFEAFMGAAILDWDVGDSCSLLGSLPFVFIVLARVRQSWAKGKGWSDDFLARKRASFQNTITFFFNNPLPPSGKEFQKKEQFFQILKNCFLRFFHGFFHFFSKTFCREIDKTVHFPLEEKKKRFLYKCQSKSPICKKWKIAVKCKKCIFCKNQNGTSTNNLMMNMLQKTACLQGSPSP